MRPLNPPVVPDVPVSPFRPGPEGTEITIRGLTKYFAGWPLYENFDLNIPKHKIVSVFGPNGCGKSTLINMIAGLIPFDAGEISPGPEVDTDEQILDWVARDAETALHPSCTARMGLDEDSVLEPLTMRVHGLEGLRVVDASSMPYVTNGNIYAPVMMLAEKAADLILGNTPLPAEHTPFYRHRAETRP